MSLLCGNTVVRIFAAVRAEFGDYEQEREFGGTDMMSRTFPILESTREGLGREIPAGL
jgi:hypothetical protein